jgi:hypothetical protein
MVERLEVSLFKIALSVVVSKVMLRVIGLAWLLFPPEILTKIWTFSAGSDDADDAEADRDRMM